MHLRDSVTENNIKEYNIIVNYFAADFIFYVLENNTLIKQFDLYLIKSKDKKRIYPPYMF